MVSSADYTRLLEFRDGLRRFLHWSEEQARAAGITAAHHQLLLAIRGHAGAGAPTVGDIADHLMLRHHSAAELIGRAESMSLVERWRDDTDHRMVRLRLSAEGQSRLDELSALHLEELRRLAPRMRPIWADLE